MLTIYETYLNLFKGVAQNFARQFKIPIDHVGFEFNVLDCYGEMEVKPDNGAYVRVSVNMIIQHIFPTVYILVCSNSVLCFIKFYHDEINFKSLL